MVNPNGTPFGERILVKIKVPGAEEKPTMVPPTATPVPTGQPTMAPAPVIDYLNVSSETVQQGDLLVVSWSFSGESLLSVRLTRTNPDGTLTALYGGADVDLQGEYEDLMINPGTYSYTLNVSSEFGGTTVKTVVVNVTSSGYGADLKGFEWTLVTFINPEKPDEELAPINGTELTVVFNFDGSVTGSTGCNPFNTTYDILGSDTISISDRLAIGQAICEQAITEQEALYLDLLVIIKEFEVRGDELVLRAENSDPTQDDVLDIFTYQKRFMSSG